MMRRRSGKQGESRCMVSLSYIILQTLGARAEKDPWLGARMLEIPFAISNVAGERPTNIESSVRFDALLDNAASVASRILQAATTNKSSLHASPEGEWGDWGAEGDRAIAIAVEEALSGAGGYIHNQMEEELVTASARVEASGDWLEAADATCATLVPRRRLEILDMYRLGRLDIQGIDCSQPSELYSPGTILCNPSAPAAAASRAELKETWLADSTSSLMACRAFFDVSEMEYAKAACLRAVRLGGTSADEATEVDMRLAAIAERHGHPSAAVHMYFHMMANPATNDHGRLVMSILGLTMVPPTLIGSRRTIAEFRSGWVHDLQTLRRNLATGATPGELWDPAGEVGRTPFNLAHQGGPDLDMMTSLAGVYDAAAPSLRYVAPHCRRDMGDDKAATTNQGHSERPVRIGFFSIHLRDHSVGKMMGLLIMLLADNPSLEVHVFAPGGGGDGDGGDRQAGDKKGGGAGDDPVVNGLRSAVHHWHQAPRDLQSARRAVSQEKLDVLVYPDLGMEPLTYFLAFARLAPVQCVWWGHPVTPSTGSVDYFLSLDVELEGGQDDYLEQMVRMEVVNTAHFKQMAAWVSDLGLPSESPSRRDNNRDKGPQSPLSFTNGDGESLSTSIPSTIKSSSNADMADILQISVPYADLAAAEAGPTTPATAATTGVAARTHDEHDVTIGEQEAGPSCRHKYLVMGRLFKLHPDFDAAIEGILEGDKDGCVILIHETKDEEWTRVVWSRLRDVLAPRGLFGRLRIMHHWLYPQALRRATAVLDTFPYGGCLTVLEGLSNGVPVVTLPAKYVRGRFALAMFQQMGYTELVADDVQEYVSLAVQLGKDREFRQKVVAKVEGAYRESLHQHHQSAQEWAAFIVRAHRGAESNR
ncbi:unnamed protein product [Ectocarpus sp. 6 AP-2014]